MHHTVELLLNGDGTAVGNFQYARRIWDEFFAAHHGGSAQEWAEWLGNAQHDFEANAGGRLVGQEIFAWSGFGSLYDTMKGFEENRPLAEKLAEAFRASSVSLEVKTEAEAAARSYLG